MVKKKNVTEIAFLLFYNPVERLRSDEKNLVLVHRWSVAHDKLGFCDVFWLYIYINF